MTKRETRSVSASEIRFDESNPQGFRARVVNYGVRDSYGTSWKPGVFTRSLDAELPALCWSHDWADPIGRAIRYIDGPDGLDVEFEFDDFDAVPRAKQAYAQLKSGTMKQFSFAFVRKAEEPDPSLEDTIRITNADCDEFSMVLKGSVPGTKVLSVRSDEMVSARTAADLFVKFSSGEIDLADALTTLKGAGTNPGTGEGGDGHQENPTEFNTPSPADPAPVVKPEDEPQPDDDEKDILDKLDSLAWRE